MRGANELVADILEVLAAMVAPGVSTGDLDAEAEKLARAAGAVPAFKNYRGYPATLCTSINEQVVHGIPSAEAVLRDGDIVSIDMGVKLNGFVGDSAVTVPVGRVTESVTRLLDVTRASLEQGIAAVAVDGRVSDIGHAVQAYVEAHGFSVVREFVGHGIGASLHEEPQVPNYGERGRGTRLRAGMVLAIEPMVNMGRPEVKVLRDGWTAVTKDGSLSAHFEHTVAVTADGPRILTVPRSRRRPSPVTP
jgi:methionyl aminopeptidase